MKRIEKISKIWQRPFSIKQGHIPVMCKEVIKYLEPENKKIIVDCTLGLGGHVEELLKVMPAGGRIIGIDKDAESLKIAQDRLKDYQDRVFFFHQDYRNIDRVLDSMNLEKVDGFLFDLGMSSYQLSSFERGFSFVKEGPLDMRMNRDISISAYDLVNHLSEKELDYIFREYGQERWHKTIAHTIIEERKQYPIATTMRLAEIIVRALGSKQRRRFGIHPATRVFQALRIAVNREFDSLRIGLGKAIRYLSEGGRICVIDFHSLEDRIVKEQFRSFQAAKLAKILTYRPVRPQFEEVRRNIKSRSAKMRVIERRNGKISL